MTTSRHWVITAGARAFAVLMIAGPVLWFRDGAGLVGLAAVALVWAAASAAQRKDPSPGSTGNTVMLLEAVAIGAVCGLALDSTDAVLLALALPPFVGGVLRGLLGAMLALSAEVITVLSCALLVHQGLTDEQVFAVFTWMMAGLGLGMVGTFVRTNAETQPDETAPYLDAQRLIRQLLDLTTDLSSGLDVQTLAGSLLSDVGDRMPTAAVAVYVPRGEVLVPLATSTVDGSTALDDAEELAVESWARSAPIMHEHNFAFPLGDSVVVAGLLSRGADLDPLEVERTILRLPDELRAQSVQLDTALLFSDFRDAASADVRKRLAREMHDGIAQDIASLGYLVDALAARPANEKQAKALAMLRDRITKIVAEVRQSVLTLRTSIGESESLGVAISTVARHLSESSRIPIQVTLDEHSTRLRPEVEAELFRITQEAMNNAIKHAECSAIEVNCQVHAPAALITVADDGRGLQKGRSDSHGLKIMRERARLVGADLSIDDHPSGGLLVAVRLGSPS